MALIFARHWIFVAHEAEIPEPGDFRTVEVGASSVILVRDDDEEVRGLPQRLPAPGRADPRRRGLRGQHRLRLPPVDLRGGRHAPARRAATVELRPELLRPQVRPRAQRGRADLHLPGRRAAAGLRGLRRARRAVPQAARAASYQGRRPDRHRRGGQLEAGDGEQPRVLPLRQRPPRARLPRCSPPTGTTTTRCRRDCGRPSTATRRRTETACGLRGAGPARTSASRSSRAAPPASGSSASRWTGPGSRSPGRECGLPAPARAARHPPPGQALDAHCSPTPGSTSSPTTRSPSRSCRWPRTGRWCAPPGWCTRTQSRARTTTSRS